MKQSITPDFSFPLPKNGKIDSAERLAREYNLICEIFDDLGEKRVGFWKKFEI